MANYRLGDHRPRIDPTAWVAASAELIGQVELAAEASIWFNCTLRGDNEPIRVGARSNIQENCVLHTDPGHPLTIGERVTVGHQAMLHGCTIGDGSLIGIQAIVLNDARIGRECLIGAGALITEGKSIPDRSVVMGSPGRIVRQLTDDEVATLRRNNDTYVLRAQQYAQALERC
jgi:carbonic anhydrase/acetyltransferase-like protein (isoleucine patch superfamily)